MCMRMYGQKGYPSHQIASTAVLYSRTSLCTTRICQDCMCVYLRARNFYFFFFVSLIYNPFAYWQSKEWMKNCCKICHIMLWLLHIFHSLSLHTHTHTLHFDCIAHIANNTNWFYNLYYKAFFFFSYIITFIWNPSCITRSTKTNNFTFIHRERVCVCV